MILFESIIYNFRPKIFNFQRISMSNLASSRKKSCRFWKTMTGSGRIYYLKIFVSLFALKSPLDPLILLMDMFFLEIFCSTSKVLFNFELAES